MELIVLFGTFLVLLILGVPVAFTLGIAALACAAYMGFPLEVVYQRLSSGMNVFALLAIPFFIYAGELMLRGGIADRLIRFAAAAIGHRRGGLGLVNVLSSILFGGISGSAVADVSALGSVLIPKMREQGYDADYAVNVTTTSATIGLIIPPSHNLILFSIAAGGTVSVSSLFLAGILPGLLVGMCLMAAAWAVAVRRGYPKGRFAGWLAVWTSFVVAIPGLITAVIIVGGVRFGVFTPTEASAIAVIYALLITVVVYRSLSWDSFLRATINAVKTTAMVLLIIGTAMAFGWLLAINQVPRHLFELLSGISQNPFVVLLLMNLILLFLGTFMDMSPLIVITTPIFLPVVAHLGMDPVQFGIVLIMNLGLGLVTPPVGTVLFVGCAVGKVRIEETLRSVWPFYAAHVVALALVTYVPAIALTIPRAIG